MNLSSVNVVSHLVRLAQTEPDRAAVVFPHSRDSQNRVAYTHLTFRQLDTDTNHIAQGLESVGIRRGVRTVLMVTPSLDFFSLTFALFKVGAVPVLIDPGMGIRNLKQCIAEAEPQAFIGIPKAHVARRLLGWGKKSLTTTVTTGSRFFGGQITLTALRERGKKAAIYEMGAFSEDDQAAILFTSGSTGVAKGVIYTHGIFDAQVRALRQLYGIQNGEIDLATFPLFALFGPALGMTAIIPDMDATRPAQVDPTKILEAIENFGVTNMFGSPALIDRVGRYGKEHGVHLRSLRRVISAGVPVPARVIQRFTELLSPEARLYTPYGATESLPVASIDHLTILNETRSATERGEGVCVGYPAEGMTVRIIPLQDDPIPVWKEELVQPPGTIGEIAVLGAVVTQSYFRRAGANEYAKILDPKTGKFWHRMGDVGYLDAQGRLWFCGRKSHRVVTPEQTYFTIPCEAVFNTHPDVFRTALVGVEKLGRVWPILCVELERERPRRKEVELRQELRQLAQQFPHTQTIQTFLFHPAFPVDIRHNAKIFREKLAVWAGKQTWTIPNPISASNSAEGSKESRG